MPGVKEKATAQGPRVERRVILACTRCTRCADDDELTASGSFAYGDLRQSSIAQTIGVLKQMGRSSMAKDPPIKVPGYHMSMSIRSPMDMFRKLQWEASLSSAPSVSHSPTKSTKESCVLKLTASPHFWVMP